MDAQPPQSTFARVLLILFRILFTFFAVGTTVFIFYNSLEIGALSSARSQAVADWVNHILAQASLGPISTQTIRKLAHFAEFTLLGFWFTLCLRVYTRHYIRHISWPLFLVLLVANVDETLQTFVIGRNGSVADVWIDFSGGIFGTLAALSLIILLGGFWYLLGFGRHRS